MNTLRTLLAAIRKRGIFGTLALLREKRAKHKRILAVLAAPARSAGLVPIPSNTPGIPPSDPSIIEKAEAMLRDENYFFTFQYRTRDVHDPWNYDPLEHTYWRKRAYEETRVHGADTPRDVKIVWEINRFKDLPALGIAACETKDARFAEEVVRRLHSWISDNPFGKTVNWSSPLEIAIRGISWAVTLRLLDAAGLYKSDEAICRSVWQHAAYLNAALSTDKIVRSNHLIGESSGLYILSSLFEFSEAKAFRERAKKIHIDAILEQTYDDGVSRESSGWYHAFVTDFAEMFSRVAQATDDSLPQEFAERLRRMIVYRNSIFATDGGIVKYGDFDNGRALALPPEWQNIVFGSSPYETKERKNIFDAAQHITARIDRNYLFVRAGEFGWGGDGFSSHAHDDLLAPVIYLDGNPILADAGTYVYNGNPEERNQFRDAHTHNAIIIGGSTGAKLKPGFGWERARKPARILSTVTEDHRFKAVCVYGEWNGRHERTFILDDAGLLLTDELDLAHDEPVEWRFHFHPRWRLKQLDARTYFLRDYRNNVYEFELSAGEGELALAEYEYSASYMEKSKAQKLLLRRTIQPGKQQYTFAITRTS